MLGETGIKHRFDHGHGQGDTVLTISTSHWIEMSLVRYKIDKPGQI